MKIWSISLFASNLLQLIWPLLYYTDTNSNFYHGYFHKEFKICSFSGITGKFARNFNVRGRFKIIGNFSIRLPLNSLWCLRNWLYYINTHFSSFCIVTFLIFCSFQSLFSFYNARVGAPYIVETLFYLRFLCASSSLDFLMWGRKKDNKKRTRPKNRKFEEVVILANNLNFEPMLVLKFEFGKVKACQE